MMALQTSEQLDSHYLKLRSIRVLSSDWLCSSAWAEELWSQQMIGSVNWSEILIGWEMSEIALNKVTKCFLEF